MIVAALQYRSLCAPHFHNTDLASSIGCVLFYKFAVFHNFSLALFTHGTALNQHSSKTNCHIILPVPPEVMCCFAVIPCGCAWLTAHHYIARSIGTADLQYLWLCYTQSRHIIKSVCGCLCSSRTPIDLLFLVIGHKLNKKYNKQLCNLEADIYTTEAPSSCKSVYTLNYRFCDFSIASSQQWR